jgi:hypothetical protein
VLTKEGLYYAMTADHIPELIQYTTGWGGTLFEVWLAYGTNATAGNGAGGRKAGVVYDATENKFKVLDGALSEEIGTADFTYHTETKDLCVEFLIPMAELQELLGKSTAISEVFNTNCFQVGSSYKIDCGMDGGSADGAMWWTKKWIKNGNNPSIIYHNNGGDWARVNANGLLDNYGDSALV